MAELLAYCGDATTDCSEGMSVIWVVHVPTPTRTYHGHGAWGLSLVYEECRALIQYGARDGVSVRLPCHSLQYQLRIKLSQDTRTN